MASRSRGWFAREGHNVADALAAVEALARYRKELAARGVRVTQAETRAMRDEGRR